ETEVTRVTAETAPAGPDSRLETPAEPPSEARVTRVTRVTPTPQNAESPTDVGPSLTQQAIEALAAAGYPRLHIPELGRAFGPGYKPWWDSYFAPAEGDDAMLWLLAALAARESGTS